MYNEKDHIIIDSAFSKFLELKNQLQEHMRGARFIDFDPSSIGQPPTIPDADFSVVIHFEMCRANLFDILKSILELSLKYEDLLLNITFTDSENLKHNKLGGRTLFYLTNWDLLFKTTNKLPVVVSKHNKEIIYEDFEEEVTDSKIRILMDEIENDLIKQRKDVDEDFQRRQDFIKRF